MSTSLGGSEQPGDPPCPDLEGLLRSIDRDGAQSKRLIRRFIEEDRAAFLRSALLILKNEVDSPMGRHLIRILVARSLLLPALSDPSLDRERAMAIARAASRLDSRTDSALARAISERAGESDAAVGKEEHARLMEILAAISDGGRMFPYVVRQLRHANPHIRSKAVLLVGRGHRSAQWVQQRLADTDPRIRANAAESLWGIDTAEARELLQTLVHDANNRVAGNAILGLHRLGDCSMIAEMITMARHESALFRATAAWAMGETGDPRFTEILAGLLRENIAVVRKRSFAALGSIRAAVAKARQSPPARLAARLLDDAAKPSRRVLLGAVAEDGPLFHDLLPTQILLNEDDQSIVQYRVAERPVPETLAVVFLFPGAAVASAAACLRWKRPNDVWAHIYYSQNAPPNAAPLQCAAHFHNSAAAIAADWEAIPPTECPDLWGGLAAAVSKETGPAASKRSVIIFSDPAPRTPARDELIAAVAAARAFVQVISSGPDPVLEDFCRRANGAFWAAGAECAAQAYLNLFTRYEIVYQPPKPEARCLKIRVHGRDLCAETAIPIPSPLPAVP